MKKILIVFTGGTIGSTVSDGYIRTDSSKPYAILEGYAKKYGDIPFEYDTICPYTLLSECLNGEYISKLVSVIIENVKKEYEGIIVTHGTDTLGYTSSALSYLFGETKIPICFVSANYPLENENSNGYDNLHGALLFIDKLKEKGVWVSYKNPHYCNNEDVIHIHRGSRLCSHRSFSDEVHSIKDSFYGFFKKDDTFVRNPDYFQGSEEVNLMDEILKQKKFVLPDVCENIVKIDSYPGMTYPHLEEKHKFILLGSYHSGTTDTMSATAKAFFDEAKNKKIPVFMSGVDKGISYESSEAFENLGIVPLPVISPVSAYIKLWILHSLNRDVKKEIHLNIGGDIC